MKIIYHDYGGSHSSVTAAAIHLGILPADRIPKAEEIMKKVPHFDGLNPKDHGRVLYRGTDEMGNQVYTLGSATAGKVALNAINDTTNLWGQKKEDLFFVYTMPCVNLIMMIGGCLSRALGLIAIGRPIVMYGTLKAYPNLSNLVTRKKREIKEFYKR